MSSSGSFQSNAYSNRSIAFEWWINSRDIGANKTNIGWRLYGAGGASGYYVSGNFKVNILGNTVYSSATRINLYNGTTIAQGSYDIYHNSDGSKYFDVYIEAGIYTYAVNCTGSAGWWLDSIPRYANITNFGIASKTLNTAVVSWNTDKNVSAAQYSLNNGAWQHFTDWHNVNGLSANTTYNIKMRVQASDSGLWTETGNISFTTYDYARLVNVPNVNIGSSQNITWNNSSGAQVRLQLCKTDGTVIQDFGWTQPNQGNSKTVTPTAINIYTLIPNANSITLMYKITTEWFGATWDNTKTCIFSVINSNPIFNNFTYADINTTTIALTGSNQTIVKGYSNVRGTISTANKAQAQNSASVSKYRFVIGAQQKDIAYSASNNITVDINAVQSNVFTMYAIDSRENSTVKQISPANYINYVSIVIKKAEAVRTDGVSSEVKLQFNGEIFNQSFGAVLNQVVSCIYKYKETSSNTWITGATTIFPTRNGGNFNFEGIIKGDLGANGFNINKSYNMQVIITDKLSSNTYDLILGTGKPAIAIAKNGIAVNGKYDESIRRCSSDMGRYIPQWN